MQGWLKQLVPVYEPYLPGQTYSLFIPTPFSEVYFCLQLHSDPMARITFARGGYFALEVRPNLTIISINTVILSPTYAPYPPPHPQEQEEQFTFLETALKHVQERSGKFVTPLIICEEI